VALDYLALLAEERPGKFVGAALRWHARLESEATLLTLAESHYALSALAALGKGDKQEVDVLRSLLRRVRPTLTRAMN